MNHRKNYDNISFSVIEKYQPVRVLGFGTYGDVHEFRTYVNGEAVPVAIKRIKSVFDNDIHVRRAIRELRIMRHFRGHPNIVQLLDADLVATPPFQGLYCYLELMDTDLSSIIRRPSEVITEWCVANVTYQLLCALKYIHSSNVVHRDLKPGNVLVTRQGVVKICDFGLARGVIGESYDRDKYTNYVTTRWYRAPEIIVCVDSYHYGLDIWAVGCIFAELVLREPLFRGKSSRDQFILISQGLGAPPLSWYETTASLSTANRKYDLAAVIMQMPGDKAPTPLRTRFPGMENELFYDLLEQLLVYEPDKRLTASEALAHPYFTDIANGDEIECEQLLDFDFEKIGRENLKHYLQKEVQLTRAVVRGFAT